MRQAVPGAAAGVGLAGGAPAVLRAAAGGGAAAHGAAAAGVGRAAQLRRGAARVARPARARAAQAAGQPLQAETGKQRKIMWLVTATSTHNIGRQ